MQLSDVQKITSVIMWLSYNFVLKINVNLYSNFGNQRRYYHKEVCYFNSKADANVVNINLTTDAFLTIEQIKSANHLKASVMIRQQDLYSLSKAIKLLFRNLHSHARDMYYLTEDGKLHIHSNMEQSFSITDLPMGQFLEFSYDIMSNSLNNKEEPCVKINISNIADVRMNERRLSELYTVLSTINIPMYAQSLLNYIGRPELGTNMYTMEGNGNGIPGRKFTDKIGKKEENYFDKNKDKNKDKK